MAALTSKKYRFAFIMVTSLFFFWGFVHNLDPVLIKHLKKAFTLNTLQSSLVDSAVFIAYFLMALPAGYVMKKFGYKAGVILGLVLFAIGSFLFIPAANTQQYAFFLGALFVIASGLTFLETAANPYADLLGDPETSTQRLNLSQSFNGLAATMAPIIGVNLILTKDYSEVELAGMTEEARKLALAAEASTVKMPYLILGLCILLVAVIFWFTHLPEVKQSEESGKGKSKSILHAFRHTHLTWAVVAQFFYVGAQVCVFSFFLLYAPKAAGVSDKVAGNYLGWGCGLAFMIGRFVGTYLMVEMVKPARLLSIYALINIVLCAVAMFASGIPALIAVIGIAFFMSIMFPTIFSLGIKDLGTDTEYGSSLIIMSIVGGAILPPVFGWIADSTGNIQLAYIVPLLCFAVILLFGLKGYKVKNLTDAPKKVNHKHNPMKRYCLALDLVDDPALIAEYEQWHQPGAQLPGIPESIKAAGILQMEIYRTGNRLFMIMETSDAFDPSAKATADAANPAVQEWEQLMWKFQQPLPWAAPGEKWVLMQQIFQLT